MNSVNSSLVVNPDLLAEAARIQEILARDMKAVGLPNSDVSTELAKRSELSSKLLASLSPEFFKLYEREISRFSSLPLDAVQALQALSPAQQKLFELGDNLSKFIQAFPAEETPMLSKLAFAVNEALLQTNKNIEPYANLLSLSPDEAERKFREYVRRLRREELHRLLTAVALYLKGIPNDLNMLAGNIAKELDISKDTVVQIAAAALIGLVGWIVGYLTAPSPTINNYNYNINIYTEPLPETHPDSLKIPMLDVTKF